MQWSEVRFLLVAFCNFNFSSNLVISIHSRGMIVYTPPSRGMNVYTNQV